MMLPPQQEDPPQSLEALLSSLNDVVTTKTRSELMVQDSIKNGSIKNIKRSIYLSIDDFDDSDNDN
jgi:hypothetical protein